ncbi:MAG TPA: hypothetical protein PLD30_03815 [Candidatus Competibacteraceae bacterium]|nr:hypothetical protein [Candidatus Competibacteraceae bacterium]
MFYHKSEVLTVKSNTYRPIGRKLERLGLLEKILVKMDAKAMKNICSLLPPSKRLDLEAALPCLKAGGAGDIVRRVACAIDAALVAGTWVDKTCYQWRTI